IALDLLGQRAGPLVDPAMHADLVTITDDALLLVRVELRDHRGHEEGGADVVAPQQVENSWHARAGAVLALREARHRGRALAQRARLVVGVEGQRDAHASAVLPACGLQRASGADFLDGATPTVFGPAPRRIVVGSGGHGGTHTLRAPGRQA